MLGAGGADTLGDIGGAGGLAARLVPARRACHGSSTTRILARRCIGRVHIGRFWRYAFVGVHGWGRGRRHDLWRRRLGSESGAAASNRAGTTATACASTASAAARGLAAATPAASSAPAPACAGARRVALEWVGRRRHHLRHPGVRRACVAASFLFAACVLTAGLFAPTPASVLSTRAARETGAARTIRATRALESATRQLPASRDDLRRIATGPVRLPAGLHRDHRGTATASRA